MIVIIEFMDKICKLCHALQFTLHIHTHASAQYSHCSGIATTGTNIFIEMKIKRQLEQNGTEFSSATKDDNNNGNI